MGNLVYTPDDGFTGIDSFFYSAGYPENSSLPAEVTINVGGPANAAPQATPDNLVTGIGTPLAITSEDLLDNDADAEGDTLYVYVVSDPAHGTLEDNGDGTYTYTPDATYVGTDSFYYTAFDDQADSTPTVVTIEVGGVVNIPPIANDDFLSTDVDTPLTIVQEDLLGNDSDPDGDIGMVMGQIVDQPVHGELGFDMDGNAVYTPDPGFEGTDRFTYQLNDGEDLSEIATVTITVGQPEFNAVPVAGWDSLATDVGTALVITPEQLLANDYDAENDALSVEITQPTTNGILEFNAADGTYTYTPNAGFTGYDEFPYVAIDATGVSDTSFVTIAVGVPANTAPTAFEDNLSTDVDTPLSIDYADLVGNDVDPDGPDDLYPFAVSDPAHGTLEYNQDDTLTYTPDPGYVGTDTFVYTAYDGEADSTPVTVTVTIGVGV